MTSRIEVALAGVLVLAGLVSFTLYSTVFVDPVDADDWSAAAEWAVERTGPNDIVRIEPFWYERGLIALHPVGDRVQRIRSPLIEDLYRYDHVLIVSPNSRLGDAKRALPFDTDRFEVGDFGDVTARRYAVPKTPIIWELYEDLKRAKVSRVRGDEVERCTRWNDRKKRWDCEKVNRWTYVGQVEREVGDAPRRCVWAHPLDRGRTLRIETTVPSAASIRVRDSFDLRAARLGGADVLVQIFVNDELRVEDRVAGNDHDWQAHDIDLSDIDGPAELRIEVDLLGSIKNRFLCLNAWAFAANEQTQ